MGSSRDETVSFTFVVVLCLLLITPLDPMSQNVLV